MTEETVLHLDSITKRFGSFLANDDISITLHQGEVIALLGENGAGKTTLMNILFGHYIPDAGHVYVHGKELPRGKPKAAIAAGVGMVHQHFSLAPNLTVLDNIIAGTEPMTKMRLNTRDARTRLAELGQRFGLAVDPDARVGDLSVGEQQRVEILKALYNRAKILVLDEPTGVLTQQEGENLFRSLRKIVKDGLSIIFISHKLNEVMTGSDRVVVLRRGKVVAERNTQDTSKEELAELMVGRRVERPVREASTAGDIVLQVENLNVHNTLYDLNFSIRAGETLGIIGVSGNGQSALCDVLCGVEFPTSGKIYLSGEAIENCTPRERVNRNLGRVPEDRNTQGAVGALALWENATLERIATPEFSQRGWIKKKAGQSYAQKLIETYDVRGGSPKSTTSRLSGGNMQKLILGRSLAHAPLLLIAAQPTRGLDEGAIAAIHAQILEARSQGTAILLISEDLDEVVSLSDQILAIHKGRLSPSISPDEANAQKLGLMMSGEWEVVV